MTSRQNQVQDVIKITFHQNQVLKVLKWHPIKRKTGAITIEQSNAWVTILGHSKGAKVAIYPQQIKNEIKKSGLLRVFPQNCNGGHQTATVTGLHHDGAAFQPPIAAAISSTLMVLRGPMA